VADDRQTSAVGQALLAVGDQWALLILQRAFLRRTRRFADWRDQLGVSESVLAARIREMVSGDLLYPRPYREEGRTRTEYLLTERALELWPLLVEIWSWERAWVARRSPLPELVHDVCGNRTDVELACGACGASPVTARDTKADRGGSTFGQVAVPRLHRRTVRRDAAADPLSYFPESMEILGDRWSTVLLAAAFLGVRRFADFRAELGLAPSVLSHRLRRFTELGVFTTDGSSTARPEYRLTDKGLAFFGVFAVVAEWGQRWYGRRPEADLVITHQACGQRFLPVLHCASCRRVLTRTEIHFDLPGAGEPQAVRPGAGTA
jgi:DNA-binding HxlR family transcriptional regulator